MLRLVFSPVGGYLLVALAAAVLLGLLAAPGVPQTDVSQLARQQKGQGGPATFRLGSKSVEQLGGQVDMAGAAGHLR